MRRRTFVATLASISNYLAWARGDIESSGQFIGRIDGDLTPEFSLSWTAVLSPRPGDRTAGLNLAISEKARIYQGSLKFIDDREPIPVLLVESDNDGARLFADVNRSGRFASSESLKFQKTVRRPKAIGDVVVHVPLPAGPFRYFPIRVRLFPNEAEPGGPSPEGTRTIFYSYLAYVSTSIKIDGERLKIWCEYKLQTGSADPRNGTISLDLDGDGQLALSPSPERAVAKNEEIVFRVGARYLSIHRVDLVNQTVVLLSHSAAEYVRVELRTGALFPDFEFTDFGGRRRKVSNIAAKYLLLDFWGSWCGPCLGEFPTLIRAYERFRPHGLEILGIDCDEPYSKGAECIAKYKLPWTQATPESTSDLVHKRLNIFNFPTLILLDIHLRIVSLGDENLKLRGENLISTLASLVWERP